MTYVPYWDQSDLETTTKEFRDLWDAVAAVVPNFDGGLIDYCLAEGLSVDESIALAKELSAERDEDARLMDQYEDRLDFDMSMNY